MKADLSAGPACYELLAQERRDGMPVDDATTEWSEDQSPYRRLGEIVFPRQAIDQPGEDAFCEDIAFSPWNTPPESQPLGSINQVRKTVYEAISQFRHARNGAPSQMRRAPGTASKVGLGDGACRTRGLPKGGRLYCP
ncbi:hypothetical protein CTI14_00220 [Methylobacterium radiotolerans]|nr:hypothetical protein CTI14_00220 [Methylobacterium radiotolerans]